MNIIVFKAIQERHVIEFHYEGRKRVVEPFCYGISSAGHDILRGFQIRGLSQSGKLGWRLFRLDRMNFINSLDEHFEGIRKDYNPNDPDMTKIFNRIF
ncbi:WYL domain-containing protein [Paenibacillus lycopersici]|uniref:WYL domain-containing protein n=1 Tax=Paenibacillus lycopersici TaxID=2704462 RepID=A0A6C0FWM4_9BACL|nr:WYL domain-containing protein [Paenibacillus lycopersici]QHT59871.1 WYL domain-containing protein [Paenibacillus lycopersici]